MASVTVTRPDLFPAGTSVSAYVEPGRAPLPGSGSPPGTAIGPFTVASDGSLTVTGLADSTSYVLYASSPDRYLRVNTSLSPPAGGQASAVLASVDPSRADNKSAIDLAIATCTARGGGVVRIPGSTGQIQTSGAHAIPPGVVVTGDGPLATVIKHTGNNTCFSYSEGASPTGVKTGGMSGFTLLGNSGASAVGIRAGDCYGCLVQDVVVGSRTAADQYSAGVGVLLQSVSYWTENVILRNVRSVLNATGVRFERANASPAMNSFGYTELWGLSVQVPSNGVGIDFGGPANQAILVYHAVLDAHLWIGVAGDGTVNATAVLVRSNAEVPPMSWANIRVEPKGGGSGNLTLSNSGKFNPRGGLVRWTDASASESRAAGQALSHGAHPALALAPTTAMPSTVGFKDDWTQTHAQLGLTQKSNEEAPYAAGFSFTGAPIMRFAAKGFVADPGASWDVEAATKAWVRADGALCLGLVSDPRVILRGSAAPESNVTGSRGDVYVRTGNTGLGLYVKSQGDATNTGWTCISALKGSKTQDWASVADGTFATTTVTVTGAALGDFALASMDAALTAGTWLSAFVSATDTVTVTLHNESGGAVDMASGTLAVRVQKN